MNFSADREDFSSVSLKAGSSPVPQKVPAPAEPLWGKNGAALFSSRTRRDVLDRPGPVQNSSGAVFDPAGLTRIVGDTVGAGGGLLLSETLQAGSPSAGSGPERVEGHLPREEVLRRRDYLRGREEVSLKKYLCVFRPLLACRWIERQLGQVPMLFAQLIEGVLDEADVRLALDELVARKQAGEELAVAPPAEALTRFIEAELPRLEALNEPDDSAGEVEETKRLLPPLRACSLRGGKTTPSVSAIRQHRRGNSGSWRLTNGL